ncbi:LysR family transcriptional regulator [Terrarubrum flagellatum]|uniref:LysR family transcriptional regulator n=1 Tax=Terrirubrum flagellatum TaxID=2895980 RepID=UPI0031455208
MRKPGAPTLDQLQVFVTVAESGSLAAAGRRLGRATSAVSYAIDNLESQLGVALFDRMTTRKPQLTQAGQVVLAEARAIGHGVDALRSRVHGLMQGLEAEVSIVVDIMLPTARLVDALQAFQLAFPTVPLRLHVEALGAVTQLVLDGTAVIGVSGPIFEEKTSGLESIRIGGVEMIPVAAPSHPLARAPINAPGAARDHVQLVVTDRSPLTQGRDFAVFSLKTWRLSDLGAKHALLLAGLGWGNMPAPMVCDDVAAGRLVRLALPDWPGGAYPLHAMYRVSAAPGPAARWLINRFASQNVDSEDAAN